MKSRNVLRAIELLTEIKNEREGTPNNLLDQEVIETDHLKMDRILLNCIGDVEVERLFTSIYKFY